MHFYFTLFGFVSMGIGALTQGNQCPDTELACHDIMNSSQCIGQLVLEGSKSPTREAMIKCVEHEGTASNLPGAVKVGQRIPVLSPGRARHVNEGPK